MNKPLCLISCPIETYSGYGANSRNFVKNLIKVKGEEWDIKLISQPWGNTPMSFLDENPEWAYLNDLILPQPIQVPKKPDVWIQITIPSEYQPQGNYNIGVTAGIESTISPGDWIEGINRMDLTFVSSKHSKDVFLNSKYQKINKTTNQIEGELQINKPLEILTEGFDEEVFKFLDKPNLEVGNLNSIKEDFCYLFTGMVVGGGNTPIGEDRKNIPLLIKSFLETFKNKPTKPALVMKLSLAGSSYMDRNEILKIINNIKNTVKSNNLPNIYLLIGEFTDAEMNDLYNHPKVKAMVSLTKGEGYGRPLLEFTLSKKPVIATNWSGHLDFLNPEFTTLLGGQLTPIHPSAANQWLVKEAAWFSPTIDQVGFILKDVFENYKKYIDGGKRQGHYSKVNFNSEKVREKLSEYLEKYVPKQPKFVSLNLPKKLTLPTLTKI